MNDIVNRLAAKLQLNGEPLWLPLFYHLLDTAGIMDVLVKSYLAKSVPAHLQMESETFRKTAQWLALMHDLGKATPAFAAKILYKCPDMEESMGAVGLRLPENLLNSEQSPHAHAGAALLRSAGCPHTLAAVVGAHHGKTETEEMANNFDLLDHPKCYYGPKDSTWCSAQSSLIEWGLQCAGISSIKDLPEISSTAQILLTGLLIMADWIASNTDCFQLIPIDECPMVYDEQRVDAATKRLNLPPRWTMGFDWKTEDFFKNRFGFSENNVQTAVIRAAECMQTPGCIIVEAPMGAGKTEASLAAAEILMNRFSLSGLAFFLPSQATSDAMFTRMKRWADSLPETNRISVILSHAMAGTNEDFASLRDSMTVIETDSQSALEVHSFFKGRKTGLLAELVVGTVDQLLMAGLKQKHFMLRHLGLNGKVVIIDECHAYDAYMSCYLDRVLNWLGAYHIPVILLSATLPGQRRAKMLMEYQGRSQMENASIARSCAYPLISRSDGNEIQQDAVAWNGHDVNVRIERADEQSVLFAIKNAMHAGGCVGIVLNTVKRVQDISRSLALDIPEAKIMIDHSQFLMPDRLEHEKGILFSVGKNSDEAARRQVIVIGTQVLEQSLDLDFDLLITDLCPMDLLLQRIGRLHRHNRIRVHAVREARCLILGCDPDKMESGAKAIYGDYLLKRTLKALPEFIRLPDDISPLVQTTYDEAHQLPEMADAYEEYVRKRTNQISNGKSFCIDRPTLQIITGMMEDAPGMTEANARAAVRDGTSSIEVIVLRKRVDGTAELISGNEKGIRVYMNSEPSLEEARKIVKQRLRLPHILSNVRISDRVIAALEKSAAGNVPMWLRSPMLEGELFLFLNEENETQVENYILHYDTQIGMICKGESL